MKPSVSCQYAVFCSHLTFKQENRGRLAFWKKTVVSKSVTQSVFLCIFLVEANFDSNTMCVKRNGKFLELSALEGRSSMVYP